MDLEIYCKANKTYDVCALRICNINIYILSLIFSVRCWHDPAHKLGFKKQLMRLRGYVSKFCMHTKLLLVY